MSRCKSCDNTLSMVDYTIRPRELQEELPEDLEEELCISCVGLSFLPYFYLTDHFYVHHEAMEGMTESLPFEQS